MWKGEVLTTICEIGVESSCRAAAMIFPQTNVGREFGCLDPADGRQRVSTSQNLFPIALPRNG